MAAKDATAYAAEVRNLKQRLDQETGRARAAEVECGRLRTENKALADTRAALAKEREQGKLAEGRASAAERAVRERDATIGRLEAEKAKLARRVHVFEQREAADAELAGLRP